MICPIASTESTWEECQKKKCALWDTEAEWCGIKTLIASLSELANCTRYDKGMSARKLKVQLEPGFMEV